MRKGHKVALTRLSRLLRDKDQASMKYIWHQCMLQKERRIQEQLQE